MTNKLAIATRASAADAEPTTNCNQEDQWRCLMICHLRCEIAFYAVSP